MAKIQILGGSFQDSEGNYLSHGTLVLELCQDEQILPAPGYGQVGSGIKVKVPLDSQGDVMGTNTFPVTFVSVSNNILTIKSSSNLQDILETKDIVVFPTGMTASFLDGESIIVTSIASDGTYFRATFNNSDYPEASETDISATIGELVYIWPNDQLNPSGSWYEANTYKANGQLAWGPFFGEITSDPAVPFNLDTWVPKSFNTSGGGSSSINITGSNGVVVTNTGSDYAVATTTLIGPNSSPVDTTNDILRRLCIMIQALVQPVIHGMNINDPNDVSPANGWMYTVGSSPVGDFSGHIRQLAYWTTNDPAFPSGRWEFYQPQAGWIVFNQQDGVYYTFSNFASVFQWNPLANHIGTAG